MRIIRFLLISLIIISIVGGIGLLITREVMLVVGMANLRTSVNKMRNMAVNIGPYVKECQSRGETDLSQDVVDRIQLRFTSNTDYQLEVVCRQFQSDPIVVSGSKLPALLTKAPGSSGLIWNEPLTSVTLQIWGRSRSIVLQGTDVSYTNQTPNTPLGSGPIASCQAYGFVCCQPDSSQGDGNQISGVTDCPKTCYSSCISRPVVLSFTSEPFFDPKTRQLTVAAGDNVTFHYVVDMAAAKTGSIELDYGDGQKDQFTDSDHTIDHSYLCSQATCRYNVTLMVTDSRGVTSATTTVSQLQVNVSPN